MLAQDLNARQQLVAILVAIGMLIVVVELVRRRKLREEYAFVWIGTAILVTVLATWTGVLTWLMNMIGAMTPASTLFFGAVLFLMLLCLQFSIRLTKLSHRNKQLSQRMALLERELRDVEDRIPEEDEDIERAVSDVVGEVIGKRLKERHGRGRDTGS